MSKRNQQKLIVSNLNDSSHNHDNENISDSNKLYLPIARSHLAQNKCIFNCANVKNLRRLSREECLEIYFKFDVFIAYGLRSCSHHWKSGTISVPSNFIATHQGINVQSSDILQILKTAKTLFMNEQKKSVSFILMEEKMLKFETGLTKDNFRHLLSFFSESNAHRNDLFLGVYLSKLRRGYTFEELAVRWNISRQSVSKYCSFSRDILSKDFLNTYLGLNVTHEEMLSHQNETTTRLHDPEGKKVILILDGTYIFIEKSNNFQFQI